MCANAHEHKYEQANGQMSVERDHALGNLTNCSTRLILQVVCIGIASRLTDWRTSRGTRALAEVGCMQSGASSDWQPPIGRIHASRPMWQPQGLALILSGGQAGFLIC